LKKLEFIHRLNHDIHEEYFLKEEKDYMVDMLIKKNPYKKFTIIFYKQKNR
jgi:hypothetical protein